MYKTLNEKYVSIIEKENLGDNMVEVRAKALTPQEAIGNPEHADYPIIKGKERLMQASFRDSQGQAFSDLCSNFVGTPKEIARMELTNNFQRAVFISSINAVMRDLGLIDRSVHCKNTGPVDCSQELIAYLRDNFGNPKVALAGLQPRMLEVLSKAFKVKVTDLDEDNIGQDRYGVIIEPPYRLKSHLEWCDMALVTGTTLVNNTIGRFKTEKPVLFFGVTIAGPARLLGLKHFCPCST